MEARARSLDTTIAVALILSYSVIGVWGMVRYVRELLQPSPNLPAPRPRMLAQGRMRWRLRAPFLPQGMEIMPGGMADLPDGIPALAYGLAAIPGAILWLFGEDGEDVLMWNGGNVIHRIRPIVG